jgi:acyl-CoA synthetase (AMP-forming)/AMP-acid ligase II
MIFRSPYPDVDIPTIPLTEFILEKIKIFGDKPALIDGPSDRTITYSMLGQNIRMVAAGLSKRGFGKGDVLAIYSPNLPEYAIVFHAVSLVGGIITTINHLYTADEINHQLIDANAKYLITISQFLENARKATENSPVKEIFSFDPAAGATPFSDLMERDWTIPKIEIDPREDVVVMPYSSGTTGMPKGVLLTHRNIVANIVQTLGIPQFDIMTEKDRTIGLLPFFHIYGMVVIMNMSLTRGATIVTMPRFDMIQFLELIQKHKITRVNLVPPVLVGLAKSPVVSNYDTSSLVELFSGAAPLGNDLIVEVRDRLKCSVVQGYGMTETSPVTHVYNPSYAHGKKLGSIGPVIPNTEVKVADVESGAALGPNERGEILVRGPQVMKGYLNNPEATALSIDNEGWIHTGDIGYGDEEGMFFIVDRLKELIKYKGFQVAPAELEALLLTHPFIADAAVIPVPDQEAGEIPKAFIVLKSGKVLTGEEVKIWVSERVSSHKKIRCVEFIDVIPKSASGKILRRILVEKERNRAKPL